MDAEAAARPLQADQGTSQPPSSAWRHPAVVLATGFWIGRVPFAPGTFGTLLGLPLAAGMAFIPSPAVQLGAIVALLAISVPICTVAATKLGARKDPGCVVLDEIVTMPLVFFLTPPDLAMQPLVLAVGFALHRLFDITKPPPARGLERLPRGLGIVADDVAASVYGCLALHVMIWAGWL